MNIPCKFRPLGNGGLPPGYTRVDFLENTGGAFIDTGIIPNNETGLLLDAKPEAVTDTIPFGCRNTDSNETRFYAVRPRRGGPDGRLIANGYGWGGWDIIGNHVPNGARLVRRERTSLNWLNDRSAKCEAGGVLLPVLPFAPTCSMFMFATNINNAASLFFMGKIWEAGISAGAEVKAKFIPALDLNGIPCMFDRVSKQSFINSGSGSFITGVGTVAQLTTLLRNLPSTGGTLTLSLPAEANTPEVAEALQASHDTKGWTLTVHEYRPAAAATYSLRRMRSVVWCRKERAEHGSYVDSTGTRWQVERCAAIFGPHGQDPTAYGYEPFDSVDAATDYWEITPYVETVEPI